MEDHNIHQAGVTLEGLDQFPPTVTDHTEYEDGGYDLELLDSGTREEPRFIRTFGSDKETEYYL